MTGTEVLIWIILIVVGAPLYSWALAKVASRAFFDEKRRYQIDLMRKLNSKDQRQEL